MCSPYPEFVFPNIICNDKALKGTEIVFVLTVFVPKNNCVYKLSFYFLHLVIPAFSQVSNFVSISGSTLSLGPFDFEEFVTNSIPTVITVVVSFTFNCLCFCVKL